MKNSVLHVSRKLTETEELKTLWDSISTDLAEAFRMSEEETLQFKNKNVARLICAIPFLAGCEDAERTAVSHLGTYLLSTRETKHFFNPNKADDAEILERLRLIGNFKGGDSKVIERGMSALALNMLDDYHRDVELDAAIGKYNPVASGAMDYESLREKLITRIAEIECPAMDEIVMGGMGTLGYWGY